MRHPINPVIQKQNLIDSLNKQTISLKEEINNKNKENQDLKDEVKMMNITIQKINKEKEYLLKKFNLFVNGIVLHRYLKVI